MKGRQPDLPLHPRRYPKSTMDREGEVGTRRIHRRCRTSLFRKSGVNAPRIAEDDARLLLLLQELRRWVGGKKEGVAGGLGGGGILSSGYANVAVRGGEGRGWEEERRHCQR